MSKTTDAAFTTRLATGELRLALGWKIKWTTGRIFGFTSYHEDVTFDLDAVIALGDGDGEVLYQGNGGFTGTDFTASNRLNVDNQEVIGAFRSDKITVEDMRAGRWDFAQVKVFAYFWDDKSLGPCAIKSGWLGEMRARGNRFTSELRGLTQALIQEIVGHTSPGCRANFGDQPGPSPSIHGCKVRRKPPLRLDGQAYTVRQARDGGTGSVVRARIFDDRRYKCIQAGTSATGSPDAEPVWNTNIGGQTIDGSVIWETQQAYTIETTVAGLIDNRTFEIAYGGDAPLARFADGLVEFLDSGSPTPGNAGFFREVKSVSGSPLTVVTKRPLPFAIAIGDPIEIALGCGKARADCQFYDNVYNFRGEPVLPGTDLILTTPDQH